MRASLGVHSVHHPPSAIGDQNGSIPSVEQGHTIEQNGFGDIGDLAGLGRAGLAVEAADVDFPDRIAFGRVGSSGNRVIAHRHDEDVGRYFGDANGTEIAWEFCDQGRRLAGGERVDLEDLGDIEAGDDDLAIGADGEVLNPGSLIGELVDVSGVGEISGGDGDGRCNDAGED